MKSFKTIIKSLGLGLATVAVGLSLVGHVQAATNPYGPMFNYFTDAPGVGDEHDFLRIQKADGSRVNSVEQCEGDVNMWFYVHNSQAAANNGTDYTGPGVAHDTRLRVQMPAGEKNSQEIKAFVSASNATTVSDGAFITCGGTPIALNFAGITDIYTTAPEGYNLTGDITSAQGATLALKGKPGDLMPGCWDHRVRLNFKLTIKKQKPPVSEGVCKAADLQVYDDRKVKVSITGQVNNATIVGYKIDFGDGTVVDKQSAEHTYAKDGTYTIVSKVQVKFADGHTEWLTSTGCTKQVTFKPGQPPVVPPVTPPTPTTLPDTGMGNIAAIFAAVSVAGVLFHKYVLSRKFNR